MSAATELNSKSPHYVVSIKDSSALCPPVGAEITIRHIRGEASQESNYFLKSLGKNNEPRGVSLKATMRSSDSLYLSDSSLLPNEFVVRFPDIAPFDKLSPANKGESVAAYISQFKKQTTGEKEILARLEKEPVAHLLFGDSADEIHSLRLHIDGKETELPVVLREWLEGETLSKHCKDLAGAYGALDGVPLKEWFPLAEKLIHVIHRVHLAGAPHGYICPSNIIVNTKADTLKLINFERDLPDPTLHMNEDERKKPWLFWRRRYDSPERTCFYRRRSGTPEPPDPFVPGDLYSLGLTLLYIATGLATDEVFAPFEESEWRDDLPWRLVKNPLRKSDMAVKDEVRRLIFKARVGQTEQPDDYQYKTAAIEIIFACLRMTQHRFFNARAILEVFRQCDPRQPRSIATASLPANEHPKEVLTALEGLYDAIEYDPYVANTLVSNLYKARLARALLPFSEQDPDYRRYTVGTRAEIVDALATIFGQMGPESYTSCTALTTATFFYEENCSSGGRVFSSIQRAVARGAQIDWLFVVNESRLNETDVINVLADQKEAWKRLPESKTPYKQEIRLLLKGPMQYRMFLREHESFLYLDSSAEQGPKPVLVIPDYSAEPGRIIALRVFPLTGLAADRFSRKASTLRELFECEWKRAYPLDWFPHTLLKDR
jgi:serine/threonine protein kinase